MTRTYAIASPALLIAVFWSLIACAATAIAAEVTEFTVHQDVPVLATVDIGSEGRSHGDMVAFEAAISTEDGGDGTLSGILITVDLPRDQSVFEDRIGNLLFAFGDSGSIMVAGATVYAPGETEMNASHPQVRAVIGRTGKISAPVVRSRQPATRTAPTITLSS